jgi:RHS repeat-associated protein
MRATRFFFSLSALILCLAAVALAQSSETGLPPFGSFHGSDFEMVSLKNGNLHVEIPLWSLPQRSAPTGLRLVYDMPSWEVDKSNPTPTTTQWTVAPVSGEKVYWNIFDDPVGPVSTKHDVVPKTCTFVNAGTGNRESRNYQVYVNYVMTDNHGTKHPFNLRHVIPPNDGCGDLNGNTDTGFALDGTGYKATVISNGNVVQYEMANDIGQFNGNFGNELSTGGSTTIQTDANGVVLSRIDSVRDSDGFLRQFEIDYGPVTSLTSFCPLVPPQPFPSGTTCVETGSTLNLPQKLTLPTGKFYQFHWSTDGNADLLSIDLPTGGSISYAYATRVQLTRFQHGINQYKARRYVTSRTVNDGKSLQTWQYLAGGIVHDPLQNEQVHSFGSPAGGGDDDSTYEVQVDFYQGTKASGTLLRTIKNDYLAEDDLGLPDGIAHGTINARLIRTTTIEGNAAQTQAKTETDYEMLPGSDGNPYTFLNPTEKREFGYDGSLLRRTDYTYLHTGNQPYVDRNIVHRVLSTIVYDGGGNQVAKTVNEYDNYSHPGQPMAASNAIQHDPNYDTSFVYRGNLTAVSQWRNTDGAMLTTTNQYDDAGNLLSSIDPLGHQTSYGYTDSWGNGACIPTGQAKVLVTTITNHLSQTINKSYNSCTATLASVLDANSKTTSYSYDLINRSKNITHPDGGSTTNSYDDTQLIVTSSSLMTSTGPPVFSRRHYDQLGRIVQTELCEDGTPSCTKSIKTDTAYDEIGQVKTVFNPYRATTDSTYGFTTNHYDGLGRVTQVTLQDGGVSKTDYSNFPTVTVTDPAGMQRSSITDAFARLVEVDEPGDSFAGSQAGGSIIVSGSLQSQSGVGATGATAASAQVTIGGSDGGVYTPPVTSGGCDGSGVCQPVTTTPGYWTYDVGTVHITVNGHEYDYIFGGGDGSVQDTTASVAQGLVNAIQADGARVVNASISSSSSSIVVLTAVNSGSAGNVAFSSGSTSDFTTSPASGNLSGGSNANPGGTVYDQGTVTVTIGTNFTASVPYSKTQNGSAALLAGALASNLGASNSPVTVPFIDCGPVGSTHCTIAIVSKTMGAAGNGLSANVTVQSTQQPAFSPPSFSVTGAALSGGQDPYPSGLAHPFITLYSYDGLGNLLCVEQHGDAANGTGCSSPPSSDASSPWRVRRFSYDSLSQLLTAHNPESGKICYGTVDGSGTCQNNGYDAAGNLLYKTSPAPNASPGSSATQTITYCHDALNRVTGKAYSAQSCTNGQLPAGTAAVSYFYDQANYQGLTIANGIGRLTGISDQAGTGAYSFDPMGRISTEQRSINGVSPKSMSYEYYLDGSLHVLHYPSTAAVTYVPDLAGRMLSAVDNANGINYVTGATYDPPGLTGFVSGNSGSFAGINNSFSFNKRLQPVNMSATTASATVFSLNYDFHANNGDNGDVWNLINNKEPPRSQAFQYDALNRLTSAQNAGTDCSQKTLNPDQTPNPNQTRFWGYSYGYDPWGNLLSKTLTKCSGESLSVTALPNNQLVGYGYDAAGNMTNDITDGHKYTYDPENRIAFVDFSIPACAPPAPGGPSPSCPPAQFTAQYTYDADGDRVEKSNGTTGTLYWYMSPGIVAESDLSGNLQSEYVFFDGERVARRDNPGGTSSAVFYYFSDHLKTTDVVTDALGTIKNESDFYPWGGELQLSNGDSNHYKVTGKKRDNETGLDYFGARYYSNGLGRFITPDWSQVIVPVPYANLGDPQTLNQYSYVRGLPTTKADLDGHGFWEHLKNWVGDAQCWCDEKGAKASIQKQLDDKRNWLINNVAQNSSQADALRGASASQVNSLYKQWDNAIYQAQCGGLMGCETWHPASDFQRAADGALVLFRGGPYEARVGTDVKVDGEGNLTTDGLGRFRGISVNTDPSKVSKFGEVTRIELLPPELEFKQIGSKAGHYEIVNKGPMTFQRYVDLLKEIVRKSIEEGPKE